MRFISLLLLALLMSGCATKSPLYIYRPPNDTGPGWTITARAEDQVVKDIIHIMINDQEVITGSLYELKMKDTFTGKYEEYNIVADCFLKTNSSIAGSHECSVSVDDERAVLLIF